MKKTLMSFAIAALTLSMMASCGDKAQQGTDNQAAEGEQTEQAAATEGEQKEEKEYKGNVNKLWTTDETLDLQDICSVTFPAYHYTTLVQDRVVRANLYTPWEGELENAPVDHLLGNFTVEVFKMSNVDNWLKNCKEADEKGVYPGRKIKEVPSVTIDGREFKGYARPNIATYYVSNLEPDGYMIVTIFTPSDKYDEAELANNEVVKKAIDGIKIK